MEWLTSFVFKHNRQGVYDRLVADFYGFIPESVREPSVEFLATGKDKLEKFFMIQAYNFQRRAIMDTANSQSYNGMLIHIRSILALINNAKVKVYEPTEVKKKKDPIKEVEAFVKKGKEFLAKKETT
jgi:hypothetical protein